MANTRGSASPRRRSRRRTASAVIAVLVTFSLVAASCSSDSSSGGQPETTGTDDIAAQFGISFMKEIGSETGEQVFSAVLQAIGLGDATLQSQVSQIQQGIEALQKENAEEIALLEQLESQLATSEFKTLNQPVEKAANTVVDYLEDLNAFVGGSSGSTTTSTTQPLSRATLQSMYDNLINNVLPALQGMGVKDTGVVAQYMSALNQTVAVSNTQQYWDAINQYRSNYQSTLSQIGYVIYIMNKIAVEKGWEQFNYFDMQSQAADVVAAMWNLGVGIGQPNYPYDDATPPAAMTAKGQTWLLAPHGTTGTFTGYADSACDSQSCIEPKLQALADNYNSANHGDTNYQVNGQNPNLQQYMAASGFKGADSSGTDLYWIYPGSSNITETQTGSRSAHMNASIVVGQISGSSYAANTIWSPNYDCSGGPSGMDCQTGANAEAIQWIDDQQTKATDTSLAQFASLALMAAPNNWPISTDNAAICYVATNYPKPPPAGSSCPTYPPAAT